MVLARGSYPTSPSQCETSGFGGCRPISGSGDAHIGRQDFLCRQCIAGPNGAGKTTFAREFLPNYAKVVHFVNADLIAGGLSPLRPESAAIAAGRLFLKELDRLANARADFAFESTLSGIAYVSNLKQWKAAGYRIEIIYLKLQSPQIALRRIAARVQQGGHGIPRADVLRRFQRRWNNFQRIYQPIADTWMVYDNSGNKPELTEQNS